MKLSISGVFLDGLTSKRHQARLEANELDGSLSLIVDSEPQQSYHFDYQQIEIFSRLGNTPRELSFGDDRLFITEDNPQVEQLTKLIKGGKGGSLIHKLESKLAYVAIFTLASMAIAWASIVYGIPKAAELIAYQLPEFTTEQMDSSLAILDTTMLKPSSLAPKREQELRALFAGYLADHKAFKAKLPFRSGIGPNAFALPSGHIVFTDEIIELAQSDAELVAILFHELGHLKYKHMLRRMLQDSMLTLGVLMITGDVESFDLLTGIPTLLMDLSYSRDFEREADTYALEQLQQHHLTLDSFATIMQRLETYYQKEQAGGPGHISADFLSTHPATQERIALVDEYKQAQAE